MKVIRLDPAPATKPVLMVRTLAYQGLPDQDGLTRGYTVSACDRYRYDLWRSWDNSKPVVLWVMLNPSTADAYVDDPTIRRCMGFARAWGYGGIRVVNLFGWRATDPSELKQTENPVGESNNFHILEAAAITKAANGIIVCAWGAHGDLHGRAAYVENMLRDRGYSLSALGMTKYGHPKHPLYLKADLKPLPWVPYGV